MALVRDLDAERWTLACAMMRPQLLSECGLQERDFTVEHHRAAVRAFDIALARDPGITELTVAELALGLRETEPRDGEFVPYMAGLLDSIGTIARGHAGHRYAEAVLRYTARREIVAGFTDLNLAIDDPEANVAVVLDDFEKRLAVIRARIPDGAWPDDIAGIRASYEEHLARERSPVSTGFPSLDRRLWQLGAGEVLTFAARTGVGKSLFALNMLACALSKAEGWGALLISLEMPQWLVYDRLRRMFFDDDDQTALALAGLANFDASRLTVEQIPQLIHRAGKKLDLPIRLVVVDYLQALESPDAKASAYERMSQAAKRLKGIAKAHDCLLVLLAQLSRAGQQYEPVTLSMIRESGVIEEASDYVIGAWRPDMAPGSTAEKGIEMAILKDRITGQAHPPGILAMLDTKSLQLIDQGEISR